MATTSAFVWKVAPSQQLIPRLEAYRERLNDAILQLANYFAARMEAYAKVHAPWTDRSTAARQGLRGFAVRQAATVIIYLVTSVDYGLWLELGTRNSRPHPIIMPTLQAFYAEVMRAYRQLVGA